MCFLLHLCESLKEKKLKCSTADIAFITRGYQNWKDATIAFRNHKSSAYHKDAVAVMITIPATHGDISEYLSSMLALEKQVNRECFMKLLSSIMFLARQGLALRGDGAGEPDSNFIQLLQLRAQDEDDSKLAGWMKCKSSNYTSHDIQNEILQIMTLSVLQQIASNVQATHFTIMIDKTTDTSTNEQVVVVFKWVDSSLQVHEDFVGLYVMRSISLDSLCALIKDALLQFNLTLRNCRGQCYGGASNMKGHVSGV